MLLLTESIGITAARFQHHLRSDPERQALQLKQWKHANVRVWHDTLKSLRSLTTRTVAQSQLKVGAIKAWIEHGSNLELKEGVDVVTMQVPSVPSDVKPYWRIPKRCFWEACGCAGHVPAHRLRVCKGCWRVLYCSNKCQLM